MSGDAFVTATSATGEFLILIAEIYGEGILAHPGQRH
jgi:hypothetical protein